MFKTLLFAAKNHHFTKTGSGQTYGRDRNKKFRKAVFWQGYRAGAGGGRSIGAIRCDGVGPARGCDKRLFEPFMHLHDHFTKAGSGQT